GLILPVFEQLHGIVGDWGIAVIMFTIFVRFFMLPISIYQYHMSMNQVLLSRRLANLKAQWKGTQEAFHQEMVKLAKEHKVNPFHMLFGLLIQSPIFITIYALFL